MKNLKIFLIILPIFLTLILSIMLLKNNYSNNMVIDENNQVKNNDLAIMLEKEIGSGIYEESDSNLWPKENYVFNSQISKCMNGSKLKYNEGTVNVTTNKTDKCYLYFDIATIGKVCKEKAFADCFTKNYKYDDNIIYHDEKADYDGMENANLEAGDLSYRYTGSRSIVENYVCFGGDCSDNPSDEGYKYLYRIIGAFKNETDKYELKLIKADYVTKEEIGTQGEYLGNYPYDSVFYVGDKDGYFNKIAGVAFNSKTGKADWEKSELNTVNLNNYYLNTFIGKGQNINSNPNEWQQMISKHLWTVGGNAWSNIGLQYSKVAYENELVNPLRETKYEGYIGLSYVNEYMYSAIPKYWNHPGNGSSGYGDNNIKNNNWIYMGLNEWQITPHINSSSVASSGVYHINRGGSVGQVRPTGQTDYDIQAIRPVFYLINDVKLVSGAGTSSNPYRISL